MIVQFVNLLPDNGVVMAEDGLKNRGTLVFTLRSEDGDKFLFRTSGIWEPVPSDSTGTTNSEV